MLSLTKRGLLLFTLALAAASSVSHGLEETTQQGEDVSDTPCVGIRTAKACKHEKASLLSHCVWCESKAVPSQCVTPDVAEVSTCLCTSSLQQYVTCFFLRRADYHCKPQFIDCVEIISKERRRERHVRRM